MKFDVDNFSMKKYLVISIRWLIISRQQMNVLSNGQELYMTMKSSNDPIKTSDKADKVVFWQNLNIKASGSSFF
jgi:hypothetical protein